MNGAETLVKTLLASGIDTCFANPGTSEMHFVTALDAHPDLRCILCLFEGGASGAADGYYRMSGKVAATLLHLAPGFGNAFANLHNARKAQSGVFNIMGEHASYHLQYESPLKGDTAGISQAISHWTRTSETAATVAADGAAAITAARANGGQIATLILPANTAWEDAVAPAVAAPPAALRRPSANQIAAAIRALRLPGAALMIDGTALHGELATLAARIAKAAGCPLIQPCLVARMARGAGAARRTRMAYRIEENLPLMADISNLVLCGAARPAGFFAYPGMPSLPESPDCRITELCTPTMDYAWTLRALVDALNAPHLTSDDLYPLHLPEIPHGPITLDAIGQTIAALMPEGTIVVDEAISSSAPIFAATTHARAHDWLCVTGGAIGYGLPNAVGAAVACPNRKVLALQGDGSAMYTLQSLWTMARERLDTTIIIFANKGYQILHYELAAMGAPKPGRNAAHIFDIIDPTLDWTALAHGHGVPATRVTDMTRFAAAFEEAMGERGPRLIEVVC